MTNVRTEHEADVLYGYKAIARFLGISPRQAAWHDEHKRLPTFRMGRSVCARRSTLTAWLAKQEAAAGAER